MDILVDSWTEVRKRAILRTVSSGWLVKGMYWKNFRILVLLSFNWVVNNRQGNYFVLCFL